MTRSRDTSPDDSALSRFSSTIAFSTSFKSVIFFGSAAILFHAVATRRTGGRARRSHCRRPCPLPAACCLLPQHRTSMPPPARRTPSTPRARRANIVPPHDPWRPGCPNLPFRTPRRSISKTSPSASASRAAPSRSMPSKSKISPAISTRKRFISTRQPPRTRFAGLAASGWHTAAVTMRLVVECMPLRGRPSSARAANSPGIVTDARQRCPHRRDRSARDHAVTLAPRSRQRADAHHDAQPAGRDRAAVHAQGDPGAAQWAGNVARGCNGR